MGKVNDQLILWETSGKLGLIRDWLIGRKMANPLVNVHDLYKMLVAGGFIDIDVSYSSHKELIDSLFGDNIFMHGDDLMGVLGANVLRGIQNGDKDMINRSLDVVGNKVYSLLGLEVNNNNAGINVIINTGVSAVNDVAALSNIDTYDPLDDLKGDQAYEQLLEDRAMDTL